MSFTAILIIGLLSLLCALLAAAAFVFYRRWRRGQRLAVLSEQSRASRVRSETARQVIKRQHFFISRYVHYLEAPTKDIDALGTQITKSQDITCIHLQAGQILLRNRLLLQSIETLKDYAALERGELTLHFEPVSSRRLLEDAISTMRTFLGDSHQHLLLDISGWQEQTIIADHAKFCTMLGHLAHAISSYLPEGCTVNFTAESIRSGSTAGRAVAWLRLSDNDTDFDLPQEDYIFDPLSAPLLYQELPEDGLQMPSLDLPFAKHLAELMGGTLNFRRTSTGHAVEIELFFSTDKHNE